MILMTTAEVADYLRLKERTVYEMAAKRQIPCTRATGKLLFSRKLIERWVEAHTELPDGYDASPPAIYAGSSDPLLEWALRESRSGLAVLPSGSADGLERLARGQAVLAGSHIREPDGSYNVAAIRRILPYPDVVAIRWAEREQGIVVAPGNPLGLAGFRDIPAKRPRVALRPDGAGSRVLFDLMLAEAGGDRESLEIAPRIALTEADLTAMIAEGEADCGLGITAMAARAGLGFVPIGISESFDLVMRRRDYFEPPVRSLMRFAGGAEFSRRADASSGYDISRLGEVTFNA